MNDILDHVIDDDLEDVVAVMEAVPITIVQSHALVLIGG